MFKRFTLFAVIVLITLVFACAVNVYAVPACPFPYDTDQPDGTIITIKNNGDEFFNYNSTESENLILQDIDGYWKYVGIEEGELVLKSPVTNMPKNSMFGPMLAGSAGATDDILSNQDYKIQYLYLRAKIEFLKNKGITEWPDETENTATPTNTPPATQTETPPQPQEPETPGNATPTDTEITEPDIGGEETQSLVFDEMFPVALRSKLTEIIYTEDQEPIPATPTDTENEGTPTEIPTETQDEQTAPFEDIFEDFVFDPSISMQSMQSPSMSAPATGNNKLLVLMVGFTNQSLKNTGDYIDSVWANKFFGASGSVKKYFSDNSGGKFTFVPAEESYGANDGIIRVSLTQAHPGNTTIPNTVAAALGSAQTAGHISIANFDTNLNGTIETNELNIICLVAGYESSLNSPTGKQIWAHKYWQSPQFATIDNKKINNYAAFGEIHYYNDATESPATIGVICHELGHDIGLPDLYKTTAGGNANYEIESSSLMASGSWGHTDSDKINISGGYYYHAGKTPVALDAWSKIDLGWYSPEQFGAGAGAQRSVYPSSDVANYNILRINTSNAQQYFLVENRQKTGWDAGMFAGDFNPGIAIWHIDEALINTRWNAQTINNIIPLAVDLEMPTRYTYPYWGTAANYKSTFNSGSIPNSNLNGGGSGPSITVNTNPTSGAATVTIGGSVISPESITVSPATQQIDSGTAYIFAATVAPANASQLVTWSSSNTAVATVNATTGVVTGIKAGTVTITATSNEKTSVKGTATVTVIQKATGLTLTPTAKQLNSGETFTFTATVTPADTSNKAVTWSSSNTSVATVDATGKVTAIAGGISTITATTADGTSKTATATLTVIQKAGGVSVSPTNVTINKYDTYTFEATVTPSNTENKAVTWSSDKPAVAEINATTGLITAKAGGTATIKATSKDVTTVATTATVIVTAATAISINATPTNIFNVFNDETLK